MPVLIVLLVSWVALRGIGAAGVHSLASWQNSARYALAVMFIFTATAHFNKMKHDLAEMIPSYFPRPLLTVYITGVLELLGAGRIGPAGIAQACGHLPDCTPCRDVHRQCKCSTAGCHTSRQTANSALVAGSDADFLYCATLVVNSRLTALRIKPNRRCFDLHQYLLTTRCTPSKNR